MLSIVCDQLIAPGGQLLEGPFQVRVDGEVITGIERATSPEALQKDGTSLHTHLLTPGFIDLHTHGLGKCLSLRTHLL